jgi:NADH:ubiquinone oxidoreductase subunit C
VRVESKEKLPDIVKQQLGAKALNVFVKTPMRLYVEVPAGDVIEVAQLFFRDLEARLSTITGVDAPDCFEIMYHYTFDYLGSMVSVRTKIMDKSNPVIDSVSHVIKGAEWIEREIWELLGVTFKNHPDMRHLLLMDDWPKDKFPLRRSYKGIDGKGGF